MERSDAGHEPLSWPTLLFIVGTTIAALFWPLYAYHYGVTIGEIVLALGYFIAGGLSITVGYHRLIAHRSYSCRPWLKGAMLIVGAATWQGSALEWAADHVRHHGYTDTAKDPYNIKKGFWHAHVGWLFRRQSDRPIPEFLAADPMLQLQDRYYIPLAILTSFVIPFAIAGWGGLFLAGVVRLVIGHHVTWFVNSWAHTGGSRPYDPTISAADSWLLAFFTFGEGFHNFHHAFPQDYRNGVAAWSFDPGKWIIHSLSWVGVTYDLKRISPVKQWQRRVQTALGESFQGNTATMSPSLSRVRATRAALEEHLERTRARLQRMVERGHELDLTNPQARQELREWAASLMQARVDRLGRSARRKLEHVRELVESLDAYQSLLEKLHAAEIGWAAQPA
jgi:stearoyl-CoA desaturase (delta-9 desaturase)